MASDDPSEPSRRAPKLSIPLQALSRSPHETLGSQARQPIPDNANRPAVLGNFGERARKGRYEKVLGDGFSGAGPSNSSLAVPSEDVSDATFHEEALSPIDPQAMSYAMTGWGGFDGGLSEPSPQGAGQRLAAAGAGLRISPNDTPSIPLRSAFQTPPTTDTQADRDGYFDTEFSDKSPLTDRRYVQPIDGAIDGTMDDYDETPDQDYRPYPPAVVLDEDEDSREAKKRTVLDRALLPFDILRKMAQRVVNLSNEPEILEHQQQETNNTRPSAAVLDRPPSFHSYTGYEHHDRAPSKAASAGAHERADFLAIARANPLRGRALGIFGPENWLRKWLLEVLAHPLTEQVIFVLIILQLVALTIDAIPTLPYGQASTYFTSVPLTIAAVIVFGIYTLEIIAKCIVSGFIKNPHEYSTIRGWNSKKGSLIYRIRSAFQARLANTEQRKNLSTMSSLEPAEDFPIDQTNGTIYGHDREARKKRLAHRAFLRHSFNRLDFVAVVSFWISFLLSLFGVTQNRHVFVFQMLSCLRIIRLLGLTSGTTLILKSLKLAAPLLLRVAFLISFFWLIFGIIGVQSFQSSFRRTCLWLGPDNINYYINDTIVNSTGQVDASIVSNFWNQNIAPANLQFCGGHIDPISLEPAPYLNSQFQPNGLPNAKGFVCPLYSLCYENTTAIYNNTVSFDNILQSIELVFVVMSSNTFTDLLYYTTNTDNLQSSLFFIFGIIFLTFWMINLLVAVITHSFQVIRERGKPSTFTINETPLEEAEPEPESSSLIARLYEKTFWTWIVLIIVDLAALGSVTATMGPKQSAWILGIQIAVSVLLAGEILFRMAAEGRYFWRRFQNWVDLFLVVITTVSTVLQVFVSGQVFAWLTFFQIVRTYRVVLAIPMTRKLILRVLGNASGLINLILFVLLATYLVAIFAVQLFRGEFPPWDASNNIIRFTFSNIYLSFIGMYQIFSSENWTVSMYNATQFDYQFNTAWIAGAFFILWFLFANFIILNMFIAVIQENFDVSEDAKRFHQVRAFVQGDQTESAALVPGFSISSIWSRIWSGRGTFSRGRYGAVPMDVVKHEKLVKEFLDDQARKHEEAEIDEIDMGSPSAAKQRRSSNFLHRWWAKAISLWNARTNNPFYARPAFVPEYDESFQWLKAAEAARDAKMRLKREQAKYLDEHPHYNDALFILSPRNPFRQLCQKSVGVGYGVERVAPSVETDPRFAYPFAFVTYSSIVAMVVMSCIATPLYQLQYLKGKDPVFADWFIWTDLLFAAIFTVEAIIKICADGFFFTPNAYYRGIWGKIDGIVLITLWISVAASLLKSDDIARVVGAFKALRALRLLNISKTARDTFYIVVVLGGWKVLSAAFVSICLLIPFAIFGLNLFRGQMLSCNDIYSPIYYLSDCVGEWNSSPFQWNVTAPRQVANPYYNFDNFGNSLFVLFQIVSQEGWVDVMWSAMSIGGRGLQLQYYASQGNAVFFIVFNLLGAVFVLTLFISVFMRNHAEQTGNAFLTAEQRSWSELRLLLKQMKPNKRPSQQSRSKFTRFCYRLAIQKRGWWYFTVTMTLILHLILLVVEYFPMSPTWILVSDMIFLFFTIIYTANIIIRMVGLTPKRYFSSSWDIYSLIVVTGTLITTALDLSQLEQDSAIRMFSTIRQFHELFLVAIVLLLIPRNNDLDQLFKTAAGAFTSIITLLATWLVLFLVFAIAMTQIFGLTKFGSQGQANLNFRTVPNALILLFRMSVGEGWNQIMADFADATTPLCHRGANFFSTDCGSSAWANVLFISWNILSMYIFVSLFVSLIFESFSYVYQQSGETAAVSREETRRFKEAWSEFDPKGTKWIDVEDFPALLGELSGLFEMRIYESGSQFTLHNLKEQCQMEPRYTDMSKGIVDGLDLRKLNSMLNLIDVQKVHQRRKHLELFSREVLSLADPQHGINFTDCLLTLAHWKVIKYNKALNLEEFLQLSAKRKLIEADINRERIVTFLDTFKRHREFRKRRSGQDSTVRLVNIPQFEVPEIFVDGDDELSPRKAEFSSQDLGDMSSIHPPSPKSPRGNNFLTLDDALARSRAGSMQSTGQSSAHSRGYSFDESGRSIISVSRSVSDAGRPSTSAASGITSGLSVSGRRSFDDRSSLAPSSSQVRHRRQKSSAGSVETGPKVENFEESAWGESIQRSFTKKRKKKTKSTKRRNEHVEV